MAELINNLGGFFIGTVHSYNISTRELEVFIPKLMPMVPEGQPDITVMTNLGNNIKNREDLKYSNRITTTSTFTVRAKRADVPLPDIGSKVLIYFIEGDIDLGIWEPLNVNFDYNVIEEEKYPRLFNFKIGGHQVQVNTDDLVNIELPDGYDIVVIENEENKTKNIKIVENSILNEKVEDLEVLVGSYQHYKKVTNDNGTVDNIFVKSSGLCDKVDKLDEQYTDLSDQL